MEHRYETVWDMIVREHILYSKRTHSTDMEHRYETVWDIVYSGLV